MYEYEDPEHGMRGANSQKANPVNNAIMPLMKKLITREGPEYYAATPVNAKIPAPIVFPIQYRSK